MILEWLSVTSISSPKKVLLVDDDRQQFLLIGYLLAEAYYDNYQLIWCQDLEKGLRHIETGECDIVLLDYHWGINCQNFIQRAYSLNSCIPVIVMTDDMEREVDRKAISEGASDYLIKDTVNAEVLERTVRYAIERKKIEQRLENLAHYDALTGLPNRVLFLDRLHQMISLGERNKAKFTLMYIDLNRFKAVNDNCGHAVGDALLQQFAERLQSIVRSSDTVARIGGDEFTILLQNMDSTPNIIFLAQKIIENIQQPFTIDNHNLLVGCSIGIAVYPSAGSDAESLQFHADTAMYQAKKTGTSCYRFYIKESQQKTITPITLKHLKKEIDDNKFEIRYTPRFDLQNNTIVAVRISPVWYHDELGELNCSEYLSSVDSPSMLKYLSEWVIRTSLKQMSSLCRHHQITLSFSVCRSQLLSPQVSRYVKKIAREEKINPKYLEFSLLRHCDAENDFVIDEAVETINSIGANFSLHSYGENVLSVVNMHHEAISSLQFSSAFSNYNLYDNDKAKLQETLIVLAHRLDKSVIANNLSSHKDVDVMRSIDCDYAQGGILGENIPFDRLQLIINRDRSIVKVRG